MAVVRSIGGHVRTELRDGWELASVPPNAASDPSALEALAPSWRKAIVPGTAASALRADKAWSFERPIDFDATDWWYRVRFASEKARDGERLVLCFDGLATISDAFFNGESVLHSETMFLAHEVDVTEKVRDDNVLCIRFRALSPLLEARRPRPRFRTAIVKQQNLRWFRTALVGRIPSWTPPVAAVGPWKPVALERRTRMQVTHADVRTRIEGDDGVVEVKLAIEGVEQATLIVGEHRSDLSGKSGVISGSLRIAEVERWWPHTHGAPTTYPAKVMVGDTTIDLGRIAFRSIDLDTLGGDFALRVNGVKVFCRGACWTTTDVATLIGTEASYRRAIAQARDAGFNMLRVSGTMFYESPEFYGICDELGVMVWQDFMFANLDYPLSDEAFAAQVKVEAEQVIDRLQTHPCLVIVCGNTDVAQQASMLGLPAESWSHPVYDDVLAEVVRARLDAGYWPSTPWGGALPFHPSEGSAHYYGVGAYLRPLDDARRASVRFTPECLAFANVPEQKTIDALLSDGESPAHHPKWKARVPRDRGPGWDFEDVRDHYLKELFGVDPMKLRYADMDRYLALSRVTTGEVMARTFAEWRRARSTCNGALVWQYQDFWPGAGWGLVDSRARPKAAMAMIARVLAPVAVLIVDEGLEGLRLHVVNDRGVPVQGELSLSLYRDGHVQVATGTRAVSVPAHGEVEVVASTLFGTFLDLTYAYRFGPPSHDLVVARLKVEGRAVANAHYFPLGIPSVRYESVGLTATARALDGGAHEVTLKSERFAQSVSLDVEGFDADDDFFHLEPAVEHVVTLRPATPEAKLRGYAQPLNAAAPSKIVSV